MWYGSDDNMMMLEGTCVLFQHPRKKIMMHVPHEITRMMRCDGQPMSYSLGFCSAFITIHRVPARIAVGGAQSIPQTRTLLHIKCRLSGNTWNMLSL